MSERDGFSEAGREAMREAGVAVFEGRIIVEAQPPVDEATLAEVAARCASPPLDEFVALWCTAFGGTLDGDSLPRLSRYVRGGHVAPAVTTLAKRAQRAVDVGEATAAALGLALGVAELERASVGG